jgi:hypothetical protein
MLEARYNKGEVGTGNLVVGIGFFRMVLPSKVVSVSVGGA